MRANYTALERRKNYRPFENESQGPRTKLSNQKNCNLTSLLCVKFQLGNRKWALASAVSERFERDELKFFSVRRRLRLA